jgi:RNA recognition motif-containing protein
MNLDIVKLFVGQIPKEMDEDSLRVYFEEFGPLAELSIIRDSANLNSKGVNSVQFS